MMPTVLRASFGLVLLAAIATLSVPASAGQKTSPFTGTYAGPGPFAPYWEWVITVPADGRVSGTAHYVGGGYVMASEGALSGRLRDSGHFSFRGSLTSTNYNGFDWVTTTWEFRGTAELTKQPDGSVTGTVDDGTEITWTPIG